MPAPPPDTTPPPTGTPDPTQPAMRGREVAGYAHFGVDRYGRPSRAAANQARFINDEQRGEQEARTRTSLEANERAARAWQDQFLQGLQRQASGDPNSRAQQALSQAYGQASQGQQSLGSGLRGTGGGAGLRAGQQGAGQVQRTYAGDSSMLMNKEQQAAQALMSQILQQQRGQDTQGASSQAATTLRGTELDNAMTQFLGTQQYNQMLANSGFDIDSVNLQLGINRDNAASFQNMFNRAVQAGGTVLTTIADSEKEARKEKDKSSQESIDDAFNGG